jgi:hypothetical protein
MGVAVGVSIIMAIAGVQVKGSYVQFFLIFLKSLDNYPIFLNN